MTRFATAFAALLWVLCAATGAFAHAVLISTEPRDGGIVAQAPDKVELRFNEPVTPAVVRLIDAEGRVRDDAAVNAVNETVSITMSERLPPGTQLISYRVISADGHPVAGSMVFSIGGPTATLEKPTNPDSALAILIWLSRIGLYIGLFIGVGGAFFEAWIAPGRARWTTTVAALGLGLLGAAVSLGCQGLDLRGLPITGILTIAPWHAAIATSLATALLIAATAMGLSIISRRCAAAGTARALSAVAMIGVGVSLASSGHAATASPQWLTRSAVFLHGIGVAYWAGALWPLLALARRPEQALLPVLHRFSRVALPIVAMLVLTGLLLAVVQVESVRALVDTRYGLILCAKLVLVAGLLGLAALNRFRLTPALQSDSRNSRPLVRSMLFECAVIAAILALVAGWRFTPPPRSLVSAVRAPLAIDIRSDRAMLKLLVSPGTAGIDNFVLRVMSGDASPLQAKEVTLSLSQPERGIEPMERKAIRGADGNWTVGGVLLPFAGRWRVRVEVLVTDFEQIALEDEFDVPAR
jgi:copper transport protein